MRSSASISAQVFKYIPPLESIHKSSGWSRVFWRYSGVRYTKSSNQSILKSSDRDPEEEQHIRALQNRFRSERFLICSGVLRRSSGGVPEASGGFRRISGGSKFENAPEFFKWSSESLRKSSGTLQSIWEIFLSKIDLEMPWCVALPQDPFCRSRGYFDLKILCI